MVMLMPIGFVLCFRPLTDASLFLILYGCTAVYFSGVMVRLMLVLAPAACCLAAIATSELLKRFSAGVVAGARHRLSPSIALEGAAEAPKCVHHTPTPPRPLPLDVLVAHSRRPSLWLSRTRQGQDGTTGATSPCRALPVAPSVLPPPSARTLPGAS